MSIEINWDIINTFLAIWASIATILSIILGCKVVNNSKNNTVNGDNNGQMINTDQYFNQVFNNPQDYSENEILRQAEIAYDAKDYESVRTLYTLDKVASNPIVFNNLGYMYANGLGMEKNVEIAMSYYNRVSEEIDQDIVTRNKYVALSNNLNNGNNINLFLRFVNTELQKGNGVVFELFKQANDNIQLNKVDYDYLTKTLCSDWADVIPSELKVFSEEPPLTFCTGYRFMKTIESNNGQARVYKKVQRICKVLNVLEDEFIRI